MRGLLLSPIRIDRWPLFSKGKSWEGVRRLEISEKMTDVAVGDVYAGLSYSQGNEF